MDSSSRAFCPSSPGRRLNRLRALRELETTIVCYESPHRILASLAAIAEIFGARTLVVGRELTKQFEEIVEGTAAELASGSPGAPRGASSPWSSRHEHAAEP